MWPHSFHSAFWVGEGCLCVSVKGACPFLSLRWKKTMFLLIFPFLRENTFTAFIAFALSFWTLVICVYFSLLFPQCLILPFLLLSLKWLCFSLEFCFWPRSYLPVFIGRVDMYVNGCCLCHRNMIFKGLDCSHFTAFFTSNISLGKLLLTECCKGLILQLPSAPTELLGLACIKLNFQFRGVWYLNSSHFTIFVHPLLV